MLAILGAVAAAFTLRSLYGVPLGGGVVLADFAAFGGLLGAILQAGVQRLLRRPAPRRWLGFTTLASVLGAAHLVFAPTAPAVLLIVVDCLRADRLSEERMPATWALAQSSVRFSHAHSQSSWTRSAMPSLLSGRFPAEHGSYRTRPTPDRIREDVPLLAELFSTQGWLTAAFVEQAQMDGAFGYARGFGRYGFRDGKASRLNARFLQWNWVFRTVPRFVLLHYIDAHGPYTPKPTPKHLPPSALATTPSASWRATINGIRAGRIKPTTQDFAHLAGLYDAEVSSLDRRLGDLYKALAFTGDHGERFGEHGDVEHMGNPDEAVLAVPLLLRPPGGGAGRWVGEVVQHVDVAPTLLLAAGLVPDKRMAGRDLRAVQDGDAGMPSFAEEWSGRTQRVSVREGGWKLVRSPEGKLYDLAHEPSESRDVSAEHPEVVLRLESLIAAYFAGAAQGSVADVSWADVPSARWTQGAAAVGDALPGADTMKALQKLGYLDDGGDGDE
jgi:arylsulfatase